MQGRNYAQSLNDLPLGPMQAKKDRGQVVSFKTSFGFIRCLNSSEQVFFHLNDIRPTPRFTGESPQIRVGDEVEFEVELKNHPDNPRRLSARNVQKIPKGSVVFEELVETEGRKRAVVVSELNYNRTDREPVGGEVRVEEGGELLRFTGRDVMHFPIKLLEGDKVEISVFCDKKTKRRGATRIRLLEPCLERRERGLVSATLKNSYGFIRKHKKCADRNEQKLFFHFSERLDNDYVPKEGHGVEFNVINDINGKICASRLLQVDADKVLFVKLLPTVFRGKVLNGLKYTRATKNYGVKQIGGQIAFKTLVAGKPVTEHLSFDSCDIIGSEETNFMPGDKVEFRIAIFKPTGKRHAHKVKLITKAPQNYERGLVGFVRNRDFGFIERPNSEIDLYFKITDETAEITKNSSVEYVVIEPAIGQIYAESVKMLPPGTVEFFDVSKESFEGTIAELAKNGGTKTNDERNSVGGIIEFDGRKIEFKTKNLKNPQIQLKVDDTVSFYVQKDLRFGGKESAICIVLAKPHPQDARELGLVISVKSDFGFLASIVNSNVFFHFSQSGSGQLDYCKNELFNDIILHLNPETVINERNNAEIAKAVASLPFRSSDVGCGGARSLAQGDFVRFRVAADRAFGRLRAAKIELLPKLGRVLAAPGAGAAGELQDVVSKEFFDFEEGPEKIEPRSTVIFDVLPHRPHIPEAAAAPKRTAFNLRVRDYLLLERGFFEGFVREIEAAAESFLPPRTLSTGEDISAQFAPDASGAVAFSAKTEKPDAFSAPAEESFSAETPAENYSAAEVERFCVGMGPDLLTGEPLAPGGEGETPGNGCDPFDFWDFG